MERSVHAAVLSRGLIGLRPFQSAAVLVRDRFDRTPAPLIVQCIDMWSCDHRRTVPRRYGVLLPCTLRSRILTLWKLSALRWRLVPRRWRHCLEWSPRRCRWTGRSCPDAGRRPHGWTRRRWSSQRVWDRPSPSLRPHWQSLLLSSSVQQVTAREQVPVRHVRHARPTHNSCEW